MIRIKIEKNVNGTITSQYIVVKNENEDDSRMDEPSTSQTIKDKNKGDVSPLNEPSTSQYIESELEDDSGVDDSSTSHGIDGESESEREEAVVEGKDGERKLFQCDKPNCKFSTSIKQRLKRHFLVHSNDRPFKCDVCELAFKSVANMKNHLITHSGNLFKCDKCESTFKIKSSLDLHKLKHINDNKAKKFKCVEPNCKFSTHFKGYLVKHRIIHSKERSHKCEKCECAFKSRQTLKYHLFSHSEDCQFQCETCGRVFKIRSCLKKHIETHKNIDEWYKCDKCNYSTPHKSSLNRHLIVHVNGKLIKRNSTIEVKKRLDALENRNGEEGRQPYKCKFCHMVFLEYNNFNIHKLTHNTETSKFPSRDVSTHHPEMYKCEKCDYYSHSNETLDAHTLSNHPANEMIRCDYPNCPYSTTDKSYLQQHQRRLHKLENRFKCEQCEKEFKFKCSLKKHYFVHKNYKPFNCQKCQYSTTLRNNLLNHIIRKHVKEKKHKCEECGNSYSLKKDLDKHELNHDEADKKFKCRICSFRGLNKSSLATHQLIHKNKRRFKCDKCNRSFNKGSDLKIHQFVHSKVKNLKCNLCAYRTYNPKNLKRHQLLSTHYVCPKSNRLKCDHCGLISRNQSDLREHKDAHRSCFVPLRRVPVSRKVILDVNARPFIRVKIELNDVNIKEEII